MPSTVANNNNKEAFDVGKCGVEEVCHIVRLYRSFWVEEDPKTKKQTIRKSSPFYCNHSSDLRLSSEKYGIKIGYWSNTLTACFLEVFLRRDPGDFAKKEFCHVPLDDQEIYLVCKIILNENEPLRMVPVKVEKKVCRSAIYSDEIEKDNFVKHCYDHKNNYDGIIYRSNHDPNFICYALFDRAVEKLSSYTSDCIEAIQITSLADLPEDKSEIIEKFPRVLFEKKKEAD